MVEVALPCFASMLRFFFSRVGFREYRIYPEAQSPNKYANSTEVRIYQI